MQILRDLFSALKLKAGRQIVRETGAALVKSMEKELAAGDAAAAEIVACECVVIAETKDHFGELAPAHSSIGED